MGTSDEDSLAVAEEEGKGSIQTFMSQCAKNNKVWVVAGTIPIKSSNPNKAYAASIMYDDRGKQVARYDKMHLFDVENFRIKRNLYGK